MRRLAEQAPPHGHADAGDAYDIRFPLHPEPRSEQAVTDLLGAVLDGLSTSLRFVVSVSGRKHLANIIRRIKGMPFVLRVNRVIG